jgi:hypothetical protein
MLGSTARRARCGAACLAALILVTASPARADGPPFACDSLPIEAFVVDIGRELLDLPVEHLSHDALWRKVSNEFELGRVDCRLARLLDRLDQLDTTGFPSLTGLSLAEQRMTVISAVVRLNGEFEPDCARVRQLSFGAPRTLSQLGVSLNGVNGQPLTDAELLEQPFEKRHLMWELARSLDRLEGLRYRRHGQVIVRQCDGVTEIVEDDADSSDCKCHHPHGGVISGPDSIVANPIKALLVAYRAGARARLQGHHPKEVWEIGTQAELDALMAALGDSAPPAAAQLSSLPDFTREPTLTVSGTSEPLGLVVVTWGGNEVVAPVDAQGAFSVAVTLLPNQPNSLGITSFDAAGNAAPTTNAVVIHDDVAPGLVVTSPAEGAIEAGLSVTVSGTVSDANPVAVSVAGFDAVVAGTTFAAEGVPLVPGANALALVATDAAGNSSTTTLTVIGLTVQGSVGAEGGTVAAPAGSPLEGVALFVPAGALAAPMVVGFTLADAPPLLGEDLTPVGPALRLFPSGSAFAAPITVMLPFSAAAISVLHARAEDLRFMHAEEGAASWSAIEGAVVDLGQQSVRADVTSFSVVQAVMKYQEDLVVSIVAGHAPGGSGVSPIGSENTAATSTEPPRDCWRLHDLRGWSHAKTEAVPAGGARARRPPGVRA